MVAGLVEDCDCARRDVDAFDPPARIVARDAVRRQIAVRLDILKAAVVAAIQLAVGYDRQPVGAAAGGRDDLLAAAGPAAGDAPRSEEHPSELQSLMRNANAVICLKQTKQH